MKIPFKNQESIKKVSCYKNDTDRKQSILAYILLRVQLLCEYGINNHIFFKFIQFKPYLLNYPNIYFNLSHCCQAIACGTSSLDLGVDVQEIVNFNSQIAKYFLTDAEYMRIINSDSMDQEFTKLWTLKESYGKYKRVGICYEMQKKEIERIIQSEKLRLQSFCLQNFVLSYCAQEILNVNKITIDELVYYCNYLVPCN